jgi:hypothetical protein
VKLGRNGTVLAVLAVAWFVLAVANIGRGHAAVGLLYAGCGAIMAAMALRTTRGRRAR